MKLLIDFRNKIEDLYLKYPSAAGYVTRFAALFVALLVLRGNVGFNEILSNIFFVIVFSGICAFLPLRLMVLALAAYMTVQIFSLGAGLGVITCFLVLIIYFVYYRFDEKTGYVIIFLPVLCMLRLPLLIPLILAIVAPAASILAALLGLVLYYFLHYLHIYTAVFQGVAGTDEITRMSMALSGLFGYREMWFTLVCMAAAFFVTWYLKKVNINQSHQMALCVGSGVYLILILASSLILGSITYSKLLWTVAGTLISLVLALFITGIIFPLDYSRTELLEFEDEEYKYYVRAVPKASISRESVRIKRIYSRKEEKN